MSTGESKRPSLTSGSQDGAAATGTGKAVPSRILADMEQQRSLRLRAALKVLPWVLSSVLGAVVLAAGFLYFVGRPVATVPQVQAPVSPAGQPPATQAPPLAPTAVAPVAADDATVVEPDWSSITVASEPAARSRGKAADKKSTPVKPALEKNGPAKTPTVKASPVKLGPDPASTDTTTKTAATAKTAPIAKKPATSNKSVKPRPAPAVEPPPAPLIATQAVPAPVVVRATAPQALRAPQPHYPTAAQRRGESGTVVLQVQVGADGSVSAVDVARSSSSRDLDHAASDAVRRWHFRPATRDGKAVSGSVQVPISFNMAAKTKTQ